MSNTEKLLNDFESFLGEYKLENETYTNMKRYFKLLFDISPHPLNALERTKLDELRTMVLIAIIEGKRMVRYSSMTDNMIEFLKSKDFSVVANENSESEFAIWWSLTIYSNLFINGETDSFADPDIQESIRKTLGD